MAALAGQPRADPILAIFWKMHEKNMLSNARIIQRRQNNWPMTHLPGGFPSAWRAQFPPLRETLRRAAMRSRENRRRACRADTGAAGAYFRSMHGALKGLRVNLGR